MILWDVKNSIELGPNNSNNNVCDPIGTTDVTPADCEKNGWNGTIWTRTCPRCKKILTYSTKLAYKRSVLSNKLCRSCCRCRGGETPYGLKNRRHVRQCPKCGKELTYVYNYQMRRAEELGSLCFRCRGIVTQQSLTRSQIEKQRRSARSFNRITFIGIPKSDETRHRISKSNHGKKRSDDVKTELRKRRAEEVSIFGGPRYNKVACEYFDWLNKWMSWNGCYATNGGEHYIKSLGYWVDYYEPTHNIVVEWDEPRHFLHGRLRKKDVDRQNRIIKALNCTFYRMKQSTMELTLQPQQS